MRARAADEKDIQNIDAWIRVLELVLHSANIDVRIAALNAMLKEELNNKEESKERHFKVISGDQFEIPLGLGASRRLAGLICQMLLRYVTSDNSPEDAKSILFSFQRFGHGSGFLWDYISDILPISKKKK